MNYAKRMKPRVLAGGGFLTSLLGGAGASSKMLPGVGTAASMMTGLLANGIAQDKASKQRTAMLNQMWEEKSIEDAQLLDDYDTNGKYVEYFANGGGLPSTSTKGKYTTKGGDIMPIGNGVEEVSGNTHNESVIDNTQGVKLINKQTGLPEAEVEDDEVIVDGEYVFSDRLTVDGNKTFANKMKTITMKRNNVENALSTTTDTKIRNGLKRQLQGIDLETEKLKEHQELVKAALQVSNPVTPEQIPAEMLAFGGGIGDPTNPAKPIKPMVTFNPSSEDFLPIRKVEKVTGKDGAEQYKYFYDKLPNEEGYSEELHSHIYTKDEHEAKTNKRSAEYSTEAIKYAKKTGNRINRDVGTPYTLVKQLPKLAYGGGVPGYVDSSLGMRKKELELDGEVGEAYKSAVTAEDIAKFEGDSGKSTFGYLAPTILDNAMNLGLTIGSPKLPKPLMKSARALKTTINVNPQVASVRGAVDSSVDNVMSNTSNSNVARANASSIRLRGAEQLAGIYGNKENLETQLKNSDTMNKQGVAFANVDTTNNQNMLEFTRRNDITSRLSANMADLSKNVGEAQTKTQLDNYYDEIMLLDLLDDKTGDKARVMRRNPYMRRSPMLRAALDAENRRLNR